MKKKIITSVIFAVLATAMTTVMAQNQPEEYLGLPGDNLNLYAVMKLFQESETLEGFERALNDENSRINNLDLNRDNYVDYITVSDYVDGNVHTIVLRAILGENESQDVAVFFVEKFKDGRVQIQLVGDEALYGKNYIIEPYYAETPNPGYIGRPVKKTNSVVVYNVVTWPVVRYIYTPGYVVWRSRWYWGYYPVYYTTWRPYYWHYYYGYHYHWQPVYYKNYRHYTTVRYVGYNTVYYTKVRVYSPTVIVNVNKGYYKTTYSRPEQRRDGEALFSSLHPEGVNTTQSRNAAVREPRRSTESAASRSTATTNANPERRTRAEGGQKSGEVTNPAVRTARTEGSTTTRTARTPDDKKKEVTSAEGRGVSRPATTPNTGNTRQATTPARRRSVEQKATPGQAAKVQNPAPARPATVEKKTGVAGTDRTQRPASTTTRPEANRTPAVKNTQKATSPAIQRDTRRQSGTSDRATEKKSNTTTRSTQKSSETSNAGTTRTPARR